MSYTCPDCGGSFPECDSHIDNEQAVVTYPEPYDIEPVIPRCPWCCREMRGRVEYIQELDMKDDIAENEQRDETGKPWWKL